MPILSDITRANQPIESPTGKHPVSVDEARAFALRSVGLWTLRTIFKRRNQWWDHLRAATTPEEALTCQRMINAFSEAIGLHRHEEGKALAENNPYAASAWAGATGNVAPTEIDKWREVMGQSYAADTASSNPPPAIAEALRLITNSPLGSRAQRAAAEVLACYLRTDAPEAPGDETEDALSALSKAVLDEIIDTRAYWAVLGIGYVNMNRDSIRNRAAAGHAQQPPHSPAADGS